MYAAAGGASLASRSRQRQRQQNNQKKALQAKLAHQAVKPSGTATPTRAHGSRQFHQLPATYLRTPQAQARKLSASYATQSKLLLPIVEGNQQHAHPGHGHAHHGHHFHPHSQHSHDHHFRTLSPTPKFSHSHFQGHIHPHLTKSATATLPLVSQTSDTPPTTPTGGTGHYGDHSSFPSQIPAPQHDSIIVTPATPLASPGHRASTTSGQLERKCSFYRVRRSNAFEDDDGTGVTGTNAPEGAGTLSMTINTAQRQVDPYTNGEGLVYGGLPNGGNAQKWPQAAYCEEYCTCDYIECAQGRAAWLERGRRCSVQDNNPASCHRRWVKRNRIQDSSLGGSSDDEDLLGVLRGPSSFANAFLYVGLGTIAIGLIIAFVGTGEKGFKTVELRLIGPSLIGLGLICCILRICFCICPSHCLSPSRRVRKKTNSKTDADHTTSLLRGESKRVSIAKSSHLQKFPLTHKKGNNKMLNEGMEALRQIATTSLFLQNEQKPSTNRIVPIIKEPEKPTDAPLEMKKIETTLDVCDISDDEDEEDANPYYNNQTESLVRSQSKLARQRVSLNQQQKQQQHLLKQQSLTVETSATDSLLVETSLMLVNPSIPSTSGKTSSVHFVSSPPPSTSSQSYNFPALGTPSQFPIMDEQHTPGQIIDEPTPQTTLQIPSFTPSTGMLLPSPRSSFGLNSSNISTSSSSSGISNQMQTTFTKGNILITPTNETLTAIGSLGNELAVETDLKTLMTMKTSSENVKSTSTSTTIAPTTGISIATTSQPSTFQTLSVPPTATTSSEAELVLSPAKLGQ